MNQKDYFEYLEPLTKGLPVRAWWYLDIDHKKLTENIRTNYLSQINNFENNMLISFPQAVVLTQLDRITENTIKEMNFDEFEEVKAWHEKLDRRLKLDG